MSSNRIKDFYRGKSILLTGGTGFFGKMIIEKLLRVCEVDGIYLIMRPKKGVGPEKRLQNMFDEPIFENLLKAHSTSIKKIHAIEGDLTKKGLGLTEHDLKIIRKTINIVFHCGAFLNMDSRLKDAVITNVRGTSELLDVLNKSERIESFVFVSTAYSNCCQKCIEEKFYDSPVNPELLIKMAEGMKSDLFNSISSGLMGLWPNSYVFTKAVAENLLLQKAGNLPVGLFRPTIVTSTVSEPIPGWTDNLYGPLGILLSSHCGVLRVVRANGNIKSHTVPGDMCINALLCFAWHVNSKWKKSMKGFQPPVVNFSAQNTKLLIPMKDYVDCRNLKYLPFKRALWFQMLFLIETPEFYNILNFLLHKVPAYIVDSVLIMSFKKPRLKKIYSKVEKMTNILSYFLINEWDIRNDNMNELWNSLWEDEKRIFNFDIDSIALECYLSNLLTGLKKYILKEDMSKGKHHACRYKRLTLLHYTLKYTLIAFATYPIYKSISRFLLQRKK